MMQAMDCETDVRMLYWRPAVIAEQSTLQINDMFLASHSFCLVIRRENTGISKPATGYTI